MPKSPTPERLAVWRSVLTVHANLTEEIDRALREADAIPLRSYDALLCLYEAPEHRLRLSELARAALLSRSGLTRLVDRLESDGLLERVSVASDGRGAYAVLTSAGLTALRRAWKVYGPAIQQVFAQHLRESEVSVLEAAMRRVLDAAAARAIEQA